MPQARKTHRVQHIVFGKTALAGNRDTPAHELQLTNGMRIGVDAEHAAELESARVDAVRSVRPTFLESVSAR